MTEATISAVPVVVFYSEGATGRGGAIIALTALVMWLRVYSDYKVVLKPFFVVEMNKNIFRCQNI